MTSNQYLARLGSIAALAGAVTFCGSTILHPSQSDPNVSVAAFAEYAASAHWVGIHLAQFAGVALLMIALVGLEATFEPGAAAAWARVGLAGAMADIATYAANQGVDGVSNHVADLRWVAANGDARQRAFEAAFAVRQIEVGLTSLFSILLGCTLAIFAIAMLSSKRYPRWLGVTGTVGGVATFAIGLEQASHGFSALSLVGFMVAGPVDLIWAASTGVFMWRLAPRLVVSPDAV